MTKKRFDSLLTEERNPATRDLDRLSPLQIIDRMNEEDALIPKALHAVRSSLARAVKLMVVRVGKGGRIFFVGAGTSGRLGILEAAECPPTFDTSPDLVQAVMAGGPECVWASREGAEDDRDAGQVALKKKRVGKKDVVVGIAASGVTPFVHGALDHAKKVGAGRILVTCNRKGVPASSADVIVAPLVGPEVISGSTRLKAGTATKLVLNRLTVATMVQLGKVFENWMVDLQPKSEKLKARAIRIIRDVSGGGEQEAYEALEASRNRTKVAIVMVRRKVGMRQAERLLKKSGGMLRKVLTP
jgi:N-acetylmuramic acid 6-phosphate etherase